MTEWNGTLRRVSPEEIGAAAPQAIDRETVGIAAGILDQLRDRGEPALREYAERFDGLADGAPLVLGPEDLAAAAERVGIDTLALLRRVAERIGAFAKAQRSALQELDVPVPGGRAGHRVVPVHAAGCYAPGGRHPLPSSVLMTAVTARSAGVQTVVVASPRPADVTLAAAHVAGADMVLAAGGAQAIGAFAQGIAVPRVDLVVGPGNRFVTAAKQLAFGEVGVDLPAGPSELVVVADDTADPATVAADLLAQAEHDPDARPILIAADESLIAKVEAELVAQLVDLPTGDVARAALASGFAVVAPGTDQQRAAVDAIAPEHLQLCVRDPAAVEATLGHYGGAFLGETSAEVFGDYGVGPNHVLPTGGAARYSGGLSVLAFLRVRTWLDLGRGSAPADIVADTAALARLEGLEAHARAAEQRR